MLSMSMSSSLRLMSGANFPPIVAWNVPATSGFLSFSRSNLSLDLVGFLVILQTNSKGHHHQVMVTSYVCSRKARCPMDITSLLELLSHQGSRCDASCLGYAHVHLLDGLWGPRVFVSTRLLKVVLYSNLLIECLKLDEK